MELISRTESPDAWYDPNSPTTIAPYTSLCVCENERVCVCNGGGGVLCTCVFFIIAWICRQSKVWLWHWIQSSRRRPVSQLIDFHWGDKCCFTTPVMLVTIWLYLCLSTLHFQDLHLRFFTCVCQFFKNFQSQKRSSPTIPTFHPNLFL